MVRNTSMLNVPMMGLAPYRIWVPAKKSSISTVNKINTLSHDYRVVTIHTLS